LTKNDIERSLNALLATIDESELTPEQVKALRECIDRINIARGKGMQA
jgi:predicted transcriptional regulator